VIASDLASRPLIAHEAAYRRRFSGRGRISLVGPETGGVGLWTGQRPWPGVDAGAKGRGQDPGMQGRARSAGEQLAAGRAGNGRALRNIRVAKQLGFFGKNDNRSRSAMGNKGLGLVASLEALGPPVRGAGAFKVDSSPSLP